MEPTRDTNRKCRSKKLSRMKGTIPRTMTTISPWLNCAMPSPTQNESNQSVFLLLTWISLLGANVTSLGGEPCKNQDHTLNGCTRLKYLWLVADNVQIRMPRITGTLSRSAWDVPGMTKARLTPVRVIAVVLWCVRRIKDGIWWVLSVGALDAQEKTPTEFMLIWPPLAPGFKISWDIINC